jgi:hypothetical protein
MDDENPMFRTNTHFAKFQDEDQIREAQEKYEAEKNMSAEEKARKIMEEALWEDDEKIADL